MNTLKSSRHAKIAGDFGEHLILYWLSKHGFECARVDHSGIDLIARPPSEPDVLGISVKSRTRLTGTEKDSIRVPLDDLVKVQRACSAFGCIATFAFVIDCGDVVDAYLLSLEHLKQLHQVATTGLTWKMTPSWQERYLADPTITHFRLAASRGEWK